MSARLRSRATAYTAISCLVLAPLVLSGCPLGTLGSSIWGHLASVAAWKPLGMPDFSGGSIGDIGVGAGPGGALCVVYHDWGPAKATAKQFDGAAWVAMGAPGFSLGGISTPSIAYDSSGTAYVAFSDAGALPAGACAVMRFNGSTWDPVPAGSTGLSGAAATDTSLAIDSTGVPYVAYSDSGAAVSGACTVREFTGGSWVAVGVQGFSGAPLGVSSTSLAIDHAGTLYVAYEDGNLGNGIKVMKFSAPSWASVGTPNFAGSSVAYVSLAIDPITQFPWVSYRDTNNGGRVTVMRYAGASWVTVGSPGFSQGPVNSTSLRFDAYGDPFVVVSDSGLGNKAVGFLFDGSSWRQLGPAGFSTGAASYVSLAVDSSAAPLCAYRDEPNGYQATVMRFH